MVRRKDTGPSGIAHLSDFKRLCRIEANKQWCYAGLIEDHEDRVRQAWEMRESPREFVKWLGEKYDLTPADWW